MPLDNPQPPPRMTTAAGTLLGLLAIVFWGTSVAFTRRVTEGFGTLDGMAVTYLSGGLLGCAWLAATGRLRQALSMPRAYHAACGGLMVTYGVCYSLAIGLARDRQAVLEVGIINYLWPGLTLLLSLPILGRRASWLLLPGIVLACGGAALSIGQGSGFSWPVFGRNLLGLSRAHLLALGCAVCWGFYSNLGKRLAGHAEGEAAPLHLAATGAALLLLRFATGARSAWHPDAACWLYLAASALFPVLLGYFFWDLAMRRGNQHIVVTASYAAPLLSTFFSGLVLGVRPGSALWVACALVIGGALLCKRALRE